jgi:putative peptide zinc metalloprotease protein
MVLVPATGGAGTAGSSGDGEAPTWVFPFDRPAPPQDGDNQALAVNTVDGSVDYDVSFALVWADEDAVLNRNEAYALASCRDCRTVAVAFQVVLVLGSVDVVVPQNLSAAVNYACIECVTYALATQLVVSVPGPLGDAGMAELAAIWAELGAFGQQIEGIPLAELRSRLTEFERRILAVVRDDAGAAPGDGGGEPAAEPSGDGPSATVTESSAPAPGGGSGDSAGSAGSAGSTGSAGSAGSTGSSGSTGSTGEAPSTSTGTSAGPSSTATSEPPAPTTAGSATTGAESSPTSSG